jgi:hypothetical protein
MRRWSLLLTAILADLVLVTMPFAVAGRWIGQWAGWW